MSVMLNPIPPEKLKRLKLQAHRLDPVVLLGAKGLTEAVQLEISNALDTHELIKIKVNAIDREARLEMIAEICTFQQAQLIQKVGHIAVIYRKKKETEKKKKK